MATINRFGSKKEEAKILPFSLPHPESQGAAGSAEPIIGTPQSTQEAGERIPENVQPIFQDIARIKPKAKTKVPAERFNINMNQGHYQSLQRGLELDQSHEAAPFCITALEFLYGAVLEISTKRTGQMELRPSSLQEVLTRPVNYILPDKTILPVAFDLSQGSIVRSQYTKPQLVRLTMNSRRMLLELEASWGPSTGVNRGRIVRHAILCYVAHLELTGSEYRALPLDLTNPSLRARHQLARVPTEQFMRDHCHDFEIAT